MKKTSILMALVLAIFSLNAQSLNNMNTTSRDSKDGSWLYYDNGTYAEHIGLTYDGENYESFKWGIMFPASDMAQYAGQFMTKVSIYDCEAYNGEFFIYEGSNTEPGSLLYSQEFSCTATNAYKEIELDTPVEIGSDNNIWVIFTHYDGKLPAAGCADQGNPNGRWIYYDGYGWLDIMYVSYPPFTWMIRAYVETAEEAEPADIELTAEAIDANSIKATVTPNEFTTEYHIGYVSKSMFDQFGENVFAQSVQNDGNPQTEANEFTFSDCNPATTYVVVATAKNKDDEWIVKTVEVRTPEGIGYEEIETAVFEVYPNPATSAIFVENDKYGTLNIIDMNGRCVKSVELTTNKTSVNIEDLKEGTYFIMIQDGDNRIVEKLIVK